MTKMMKGEVCPDDNKLPEWTSEHGQITKIWFQKAAEVKRFE
jgi:hypothetical protein